jgi:hypothetical protein
VVWRAASAILEGGPGSDDDGGGQLVRTGHLRYQPVAGEYFDGLLGLALVHLDQQVAARFQPSLRRGGHPPLDVKPVRATRGSCMRASGGSRLIAASVRRASPPDGRGRHIGS